MKKIIFLALLALVSTTIFGFERITVNGIVFDISFGNGAPSPGGYYATVVSLPNREVISIPKYVRWSGMDRTVLKINSGAFQNCSNLSAISIPSSIMYISSIISGCPNLVSVVIDENNSYFDSRNNCNAIINTYSNTLIAGCKNSTIPDGVVGIGNNAFLNCINLENINIPEGVVGIGESSFSGCNQLTSITIPSSTESIGEYAFQSCTGLKMLCCYAIEPPLVNSNSFDEVNTSEIILLVPDISIEKYKNDAVWGEFLIDTETSILSSSCKTKEKLPNYNLNGYSLTESTKGINIIHLSDGTVKKVMVK